MDISHREIESRLDTTMRDQGWLRVKDSKGVFGNLSRPDRIFTKGQDVIIFEIKPSYCDSSEIAKGIGQLMCFLPYPVKLYLVLPEVWVKRFALVFKELPGLGVILVGEQVSIFQRSNRGTEPLSQLKTHRLTRDFLWRFLKKRCPEDGWYSLNWIEDAFNFEYPSIAPVYRPVIAKLVYAMGYGRDLRSWGDIRGEFPDKSNPNFHIVLNMNLGGVFPTH